MPWGPPLRILSGMGESRVSHRKRVEPQCSPGVELQDLQGVGPKTAERLASAGLDSIEAIAFAVPRRYRRLFVVEALSEANVGREIRIAGTCCAVSARRFGRRGSCSARFAVVDEDGQEQDLRTSFFGRPWLAQSLRVGERFVLEGTLRKEKGGWQLHAPRVSGGVVAGGAGANGAGADGACAGGAGADGACAGGAGADGACADGAGADGGGEAGADAAEQGGGGALSSADRIALEPQLDRIDGVAERLFAKIVAQAVDLVCAELVDELTRKQLDDARMIDLASALRELHRPSGDEEALEKARRRVALAEASTLLAEVRSRRARRSELSAPSIVVDDALDARVRARLPFVLSPDQERCVGELCSDLARTQPMARLLHGDVGSGKTLVAVYAALATAARGHSAVLLAPTELLAEQHASRIAASLAGSKLPVLCLTQSIGARRRREVQSLLASGAACVCVGTHALLSESVQVPKLGLLVIDEQQRFGVRQRGQLFRQRDDGLVPHVLVMSATPIPRTMATALYGDLDLSELREAPFAREKIATRVVPSGQWAEVRAEIERRVGEGERVYVVCPRIGGDDGPDADEHAALATHRELSGRVRCALVHGRLEAKQRQRAQEAFRSGQIDCLVATTVVEVGVDVPEATLIVIRDAERLGLSSLHQLRGRVGRGQQPGRCVLLGDPDNERLALLESCHDGFAIAEADLRQRGSGNLTGSEQHGHRRFRCLDPLADLDLLRRAARSG